jgi:pimeloyl-ACP methyl ester carboxylesterase
MEAQKVPPMSRALQLQLQKQLLDITMQSTDEASAIAAFDAWWEMRSKESAGPFTPSGTESDLMKNMGDQLRTQLKSLSNPWMRFFLSYDPAPTLQKLKCPVLAINGSLDLQVPVSQNLPVIEASLKAGGNKDYAVKELPGLNHLFQQGKTGAPTEYVEIEVTMNPKALEVVGEWVTAHAGIKRR